MGWINSSAKQAIRAGRSAAKMQGNQALLGGITGGVGAVAQGYAGGGFDKPVIPAYSYQSPNYYNNFGDVGFGNFNAYS